MWQLKTGVKVFAEKSWVATQGLLASQGPNVDLTWEQFPYLSAFSTVSGTCVFCGYYLLYQGGMFESFLILLYRI